MDYENNFHFLDNEPFICTAVIWCWFLFATLAWLLKDKLWDTKSHEPTPLMSPPPPNRPQQRVRSTCWSTPSSRPSSSWSGGRSGRCTASSWCCSCATPSPPAATLSWSGDTSAHQNRGSVCQLQYTLVGKWPVQCSAQLGCWLHTDIRHKTCSKQI